MARVKKTARTSGKAPHKKLDKSMAARKAPTVAKACVKKPCRYRPGTVALRKIQRYQKTTDLLIPNAPMSGAVREVLREVRKAPDYRM